MEKAQTEPSVANEHIAPCDNSPKPHSLEGEIRQNEKGGEEIREEFEDGAKEQTEPCPPSPPNPFDESDEEELKEEEQPQPAAEVTNGVLPLTPVRSTTEETRPIPAPRKVSDSSPSARPVPRPRPPRPLQSPAVSGGYFSCISQDLTIFLALFSIWFMLIEFRYWTRNKSG